MRSLRTSKMFGVSGLSGRNLFACGLLALFTTVGCGDVGEAVPNQPVPADPPDGQLMSNPMEQPPLDLFVDGVSSGMCSPADKVYVETLPDTDASADDLPLTIVQNFTLPAGVGKTETRTVFTSESAFRAVFGSKPAEIDFSKEWVMFYSPGETVSTASTVKVVRVRQRIGSVRVTTVLGKPSTSCVDPPPTMPYVLVRFPSPGWTSCRVSFYHRDDSIACPPPWEPGPTCTGTLTTAGLAEIMKRPAGFVTTHSVYYPTVRQSKTLGDYQIAHFQRSCTPTSCTAWTSYPLEGLLDYYRVGQMFYYEDTRSTPAYRALSSVSREWVIDFTSGSTTYKGDCGRWADGQQDVIWSGSGTAATISRFSLKDEGACRIAASSAGASFMPIKDKYGAVDTLAGVMTDRCVLLKRKVTTPDGPSNRIENLTTFYTSW